MTIGGYFPLLKKFWYENFLQRLVEQNQLTHSFPMQPFLTPWKHQKTVRFSDIFRG